VHVAPGAHHSAAEQQNRNLLLDPTAHVDTRPQLEILNDDVKCSHGATIGRLDEVALFYLRSRGIDQVEARRLLTGAFAAPILEALPEDALRDRARPWLEF
jgi:Fe-S cluster assembly protein SufD